MQPEQREGSKMAQLESLNPGLALLTTQSRCDVRQYVEGVYAADTQLGELLKKTTTDKPETLALVEDVLGEVMEPPAKFVRYDARRSMSLVRGGTCGVPKIFPRERKEFRSRLMSDAYDAAKLLQFKESGMRPTPNGDRTCPATIRPLKDLCATFNYTTASFARTLCTADNSTKSVTKYLRVGEWESFVDDFLIASSTGTVRILASPHIRSPIISAHDVSDLVPNNARYQFGFYGTVQTPRETKMDNLKGASSSPWMMWFKSSKYGTGLLSSIDGTNWKSKHAWQFDVASSAALISLAGRNGTYVATYQCPYPKITSPRLKPCLPYFGLCFSQSLNGVDWHKMFGGKPAVVNSAKAPLNADTQSQIIWVPSRDRFLLYTRFPFATRHAWRDIRGVGVLETVRTGAQCTTSTVSPFAWNECMMRDWRTLRAWKLDQEGLDEHLLRHAYVIGLTYYAGVYLGLLTIIDKPKDTRIERDASADTLSTYLVTSRDALNWDLGWVYARKPLLPTGSPGSWDSGIVLAASNIGTNDGEHFIFYEGGRGRHDDRHATPSKIGLARFSEQRLSGLTAATIYSRAFFSTKNFVLPANARSLVVNANATHGSISISISSSRDMGTKVADFSLRSAVPFHREDSSRLVARWGHGSSISQLASTVVSLQFHIGGKAVIYAFSIV